MSDNFGDEEENMEGILRHLQSIDGAHTMQSTQSNTSANAEACVSVMENSSIYQLHNEELGQHLWTFQ